MDIEDWDIRRYMRSILRRYPEQNTPTKSWPKDAVIDYAALHYVIDELCDRLLHVKNKDTNEIFFDFYNEVQDMVNAVGETSASKTMRLYWIDCESHMIDLRYLYFDVG